MEEKRKPGRPLGTKKEPTVSYHRRINKKFFKKRKVTNGVKEAIEQKIKSLKVKYWQIVFEEFEEITDRLTSTYLFYLYKQWKVRKS